MTILKKIYYSFIFLADQRFNTKSDYIEKGIVAFKLLCAFAPIAYFLDLISLWFKDNQDFVSGFVVVVSINAWLGIKKHRKLKTDSFEQFYKKTSIMLTVVIVTYVILSIISKFAGDSRITEGFNVLVQVSTLFYPASKALKSVFIISNGEYPPIWLMRRIYSFEEEGDLGELFKRLKAEEKLEKNKEEDNPLI